jgi:hypothetical protein
MTGSENRPWLELEVALFLSMIEENRSIGEIEFALSRTEKELEAKAVELQRDLPREFETSFFLHVRNPRERRMKSAPKEPL